MRPDTGVHIIYMDNNENKIDESGSEVLGMTLDYDGGNTLNEATRWAKFQSITSIICGGLLFLLLVILGPIVVARYADELPVDAGVIGLAIMAIAVYIAAAIVGAVYLLRFTLLAKRGIETQVQPVFNRGMKSLKIYLVITGILSVIVLAEVVFVLINQF